MNATIRNISASNFGEDPTATAIWSIYPPIVFMFGTIGNILSAIVMFRHKALRATPTAFYLGTIAVSDSLYLLNSLVDWVATLATANSNHEIDCKVSYFWAGCTTLTSSVLLSLMTIDRVLLIVCPVWSKEHCVLRAAKATCAVTAVSMCILNLHFFWTVERPVETDSTDNCVATVGNEFWYYSVWTWLNFAIYSGMPAIVLILGHGILIYTTVKSSYHARSQSKKSMNVLLLLTATVFIVTTTPMMIKSILSGNIDSEANSAAEKHMWDILDSVTDNLISIHHASSFYLYVLSGQTFRRYVRETFCAVKVAPAVEAIRRNS